MISRHSRAITHRSEIRAIAYSTTIKVFLIRPLSASVEMVAKFTYKMRLKALVVEDFPTDKGHVDLGIPYVFRFDLRKVSINDSDVG